MRKPVARGTLWDTSAPLLPSEPPKPAGGPSRGPHRAAVSGMLFVLKSSIPWDMLPQAMGCGRGVTCWRRRRAWQKAGVRECLPHAFLERLGAADQITWRRASADSARLSVSALERHS
jgi:transposase